MKKLFAVWCCCFFSMAVFGKGYLIFTTDIQNNIPVNNLTVVPLNPNYYYYLYVVQDQPFNTNAVFFDISALQSKTGTYEPFTTFKIDVDPLKGHCWQTVNFNMPVRIRIRAYTDSATIAENEVELVQPSKEQVQLMDKLPPQVVHFYEQAKSEPPPPLPSLKYPIFPEFPEFPTFLLKK